MLEGRECQAVGYSIETQVCFLKLKKNIFSVINVNWQWVQGYASKHRKWLTARLKTQNYNFFTRVNCTRIKPVSKEILVQSIVC